MASAGSIPLTGDRKADADILAFYKARQKLIERGDLCHEVRHLYVLETGTLGAYVHY